MLATLAPSLKPSVRRAPANPAARIEPQSMRDTSGERGISEAALHSHPLDIPIPHTVRANTFTHTKSSLTPAQQPHTQWPAPTPSRTHTAATPSASHLLGLFTESLPAVSAHPCGSSYVLREEAILLCKQAANKPKQLMFRAYHDGQALLGLKHPWDH